MFDHIDSTYALNPAQLIPVLSFLFLLVGVVNFLFFLIFSEFVKLGVEKALGPGATFIICFDDFEQSGHSMGR